MQPAPKPRRHPPNSLAKSFRMVHERWLNLAIRHRRRYPVIPALRVESGGFKHLTNTPLGRAWAEQWWQDTFRALDAMDR